MPIYTGNYYFQLKTGNNGFLETLGVTSANSPGGIEYRMGLRTQYTNSVLTSTYSFGADEMLLKVGQDYPNGNTSYSSTALSYDSDKNFTVHCSTAYDTNIIDPGSIKSTIAGGSQNRSIGYANFIGGGEVNLVCSSYGHYHSAILNGYYNNIYGNLDTIIGGTRNQIGLNGCNGEENSYGFIANGDQNVMLGASNTLLNGRENRVLGNMNLMGGGYRNCIDTTVGDAFWNNTAYYAQKPSYSFIGHGLYNCILDSAQNSVIVGGKQNVIQSGSYGSILGGFNNSIENAPHSFIIGSRSHISNLLTGYYDRLGGVSGMGIISDGYTPIFNYQSNKLVISFKDGIVLSPGIRIATDVLGPKDGLDRVAGDLRYQGYTGTSYINTVTENLKPINIGTLNDLLDYTDISGYTSGVSGIGMFTRVYNPSVVMGNGNLGGHSNILLGHGNSHRYEGFNSAINGLYKFTGIYGTGYIDGIPQLQGRYKFINSGSWPFSDDSWPYYQGMNIAVGFFNDFTGGKNSIIGNSNSVSGVSNGSLVLGDWNAILPPDTKFYYYSDNTLSGITYGTGITALKDRPISIGFSNLNLDGSSSINFGHVNLTKTQNSQIIGRRNFATGTYLVGLGAELTVLGFLSTNIGYGNTLASESGYFNQIFGFNNIVDTYQPLGYTSENQIFGNINYARGNSNLLLGQKNVIDTLTGFGNQYSGFYTAFSTTVGNNNQALGSYNGLFGMYNRSTGLNNYIFGAYNNTQGLETLSLGLVNNNYGSRSTILGNSNAAYGNNNTIIGNQGYAVNNNQISLGGGDGLASWPGSSQKNYLFWKGITSGTTRSELMLDGITAPNYDYTSGKAFIHSGMIWNGKINIIAAETGLGNILTQERYVTVANKNNGIHVISNQLVSSSTSGTATWGITLSGDNTNKAICINATGEANKFIYWNIVGEFNQVFVPTNETVYRKEYANNSINNEVLKSGSDLWNSNDPNMSIWQTDPKFFFR